MKRLITSAKRTRPYTVSKAKLHKAVFYTDKVEIVPAFTKPIQNYHFIDAVNPKLLRDDSCIDIQRLEYGLDQFMPTTYSKESGISISDMKAVVCNYIIDTQGQLDTAALMDDEDLSDIVTVSLHDAMIQAANKIESDLASYSNDPTIIIAKVTLSIYGYGNTCLEASEVKHLITWGSDGIYVEPMSDCYWVLRPEYPDPNNKILIYLDEVKRDSSSFQRKLLPAIGRYLSEPLERLRR